MLLDRLRMPYSVAVPDVDETPRPAEAPEAAASRLAELKARAVADRFPEAVIIGSDQVAVLDGAALGKPGDHAPALAQLRAMRGRSVVFHTAVCVFDSRTGACQAQ